MTRDDRLALDKNSKGLLKWEIKGRPHLVHNSGTFCMNKNASKLSKAEKKLAKRRKINEKKIHQVS